VSTYFRKSKKIGPIRFTASKSGIGVSAGVPGFRVTKRADGKVQRTVSLPGTGIRNVETIGGKSKAPQRAGGTGSRVAPSHTELTIDPARRPTMADFKALRAAGMKPKQVRLVIATWWHERDTTTTASGFFLSPDSHANRKMRARRFARLDLSSLTVEDHSGDTNRESQ
jgi:hypothetical protein